MTTIVPIPVETTMRRALTGALATDPSFDERRRRVRRPAAPRRTAEGTPVVRTPAAAHEG